MTIEIATYLLYLGISIALTVWVAHTLQKNGRIFLVDVFHGNEPLADSINHLLLVGFYLMNIGYVSLALKYGDKAADLEGLLEALSTKVGAVLLIDTAAASTPRRCATDDGCSPTCASACASAS